MGKVFLFMLLWRITGNPLLAIVILFLLYYWVDLRYVGLLPNFMVPIRRQMRSAALQRQVEVNPHDTPAKIDLAQLCIERRRYTQALDLLGSLPVAMQEDPDVLYDTAVCHLHQNRIESGEKLARQALAKNASLRYGQPYLQLASALCNRNPEQALADLQAFRNQNQSSCEAEYRMGQILTRLKRKSEAREAWIRCLRTYRDLPAFRKRSERRYAVRARLRLLF